MKKNLFLTSIIILILTANAFGQPKRKKTTVLPEVNDEVLVAFRKKHTKPKTIHRRKSTKRKKLILQFDEADAIFGKRRKRGVTHDPEFETWANRQHKPGKTRKP